MLEPCQNHSYCLCQTVERIYWWDCELRLRTYPISMIEQMRMRRPNVFIMEKFAFFFKVDRFLALLFFNVDLLLIPSLAALFWSGLLVSQFSQLVENVVLFYSQVSWTLFKFVEPWRPILKFYFRSSTFTFNHSSASLINIQMGNSVGQWLILLEIVIASLLPSFFQFQSVFVIVKSVITPRINRHILGWKFISL